MNCWEFMECQREPGGNNSGTLGTCPAALSRESNGINSGKNGGRICWAIAGTKCGKKACGSFTLVFKDCFDCDFYKLVKAEEDAGFVMELPVNKP